MKKTIVIILAPFPWAQSRRYFRRDNPMAGGGTQADLEDKCGNGKLGSLGG